MDITNTFATTMQILFPVINLFFSFWFIAIFAPVSAKKRSKNLLANIFAAWVFVALLRVIVIFDPKPVASMFIPEPLNTLLFVCTGLVLSIILILRRRSQNRAFQKQAHSLRQIEDFIQLSPREFEDMIVELYHRAGHQAKRTGATGDHGVDVTVEAKTGEKWVVQCKRWRGSVGEPVVRDFYGVVQHEKADKGIIFTTGKFTEPALQWAKGKPITLYDGAKLVEVWSRSQPKSEPKAQVVTT